MVEENNERTLNARGKPARIRKKKKSFCDEDTPHPRASSAKKLKQTSNKETGIKSRKDASFGNKTEKKIRLQKFGYPVGISPIIGNNPLLSEANKIRFREYHSRLVEKIVLTTRILKIKRVKVDQLKVMNEKGEEYNSLDTVILRQFEYEYALILIDLEQLNRDLHLYLNDIQKICYEIAPNPSVISMLTPSYKREKCREEARKIVQDQNSIVTSINNFFILDLITDLTALLLEVKNLSVSPKNQDLKFLKDTVEQIKQKLTPANQLLFHNSVEIDIERLLGQKPQFVNKTASK